MSLTPRAAGKLMLYPRHNFQIGREAHANVGSCVSAYSCDHGSHGRLWCACFSSKGALCVRCMAEIGPCRELPPSPDAPGGGPRCTARSILPPCPNKRPGVGRCGGEREGNIERVRQWRCCAFRSPPFSARNPPGEGRIVTRGVHHAQHRLLDVEVMMLVIKMALRAPVSPRRMA